MKPLTFPLFLARHPAMLPALLAGAKAKAIGTPVSFAEVTFYPIHAYGGSAPPGTAPGCATSSGPRPRRPTGSTGPSAVRTSWARRWRPGSSAGRSPTRCGCRSPERVTTRTWRTSVWKACRELLVGHIVVTEELPDPEADGSPTVFDPSRVVDGIELSDDPILRYRPAAYSESISRRS